MSRRIGEEAARACFQALEGRVLLSASMELTPIGTYETGPDMYAKASAEIVVYDPASTRLFIVNDAAQGVDVVHIGRPEQPRFDRCIDVSAFGSPTSVAVRDNVVAIAVENHNPQLPGTVAFYKVNGQFIGAVEVGALPDMLTFTSDGTKLLVANEGEPNSYKQPDSVDPEGTISIIHMPEGIGNVKRITQDRVVTAGFTAFNSRKDELVAAGVRIFGPNATVAQDLEPECIAVSADSRFAYVTLQENNAMAIVDIAAGVVTDIVPMGYKDFSTGPGFDGTDDKAISIANWPVYGMYQPDEMRAITIGGQTFLVMANEGDGRDWPGYKEDTTLGKLKLDPTVFPDAATLKLPANLGNLVVTTASGDTDGDGFFDQIHMFGGRSFSIRTVDGTLIYDSGDDFERITAAAYPQNFNANFTNNTIDGRSRAKGPEPEALITGVIDGRTYAFVALERIGGVMVYDVSNPWSPVFMTYVNNRNFGEALEPGEAGDLSPEGLAFISASDSPNGLPLLVVANEVSGTVTIFSITFGGSMPATLAAGEMVSPVAAALPKAGAEPARRGGFVIAPRGPVAGAAERAIFSARRIASDDLLRDALELLG